jgi:hypothetical protein
MNRDEGMQKINPSEFDAGRETRHWQRPQVIRLQAGRAEVGTRSIVQDGPLSAYS